MSEVAMQQPELPLEPTSAPPPIAALDKSPAELKLEILDAISEHLQTNGPKNWDLVRERPEFTATIGAQAGEAGRRKFWRWRKQVTEEPAADKTRPHEGREAASKHLEWAETETVKLQAQHPELKIPAAFIAKVGAAGRRYIDLAALSHQTLEDIGALRQAAFVRDDSVPSGQRLQDAQLLDLAIRRSMQIMDLMERIGKLMWDHDNNEKFYEEIIKIVIEAIPKNEQRAAMLRLKELNSARA